MDIKKFKEIAEENSPILFNIEDPRYYKAGNSYVVCSGKLQVEGSTTFATWNNSVEAERRRILDSEITIPNPGSDIIDDEDEDIES